MARFYVAGPLFSAQDREQLTRIDAALVRAGHTTFLPHRDGSDDAATRGPADGDADERRRRVFRDDLAGLGRADGVVALLDGPDCDAGTAFEIGWAHANRRPVLGVRTDFRTLGPEGPVSLMVYAACERFLHADAMPWAEVEAKMLGWAAGVKPFGGRLVRDGVPRLVQSQGHALKFRKAAPDERPIVLKAKIREAAEALLASDAGDEPDALADLLEATEAFLRDRGHDKGTLRAVKDGKWKAKGGYEDAWIVDS